MENELRCPLCTSVVEVINWPFGENLVCCRTINCLASMPRSGWQNLRDRMDASNALATIGNVTSTYIEIPHFGLNNPGFLTISVVLEEDMLKEDIWKLQEYDGPRVPGRVLSTHTTLAEAIVAAAAYKEREREQADANNIPFYDVEIGEYDTGPEPDYWNDGSFLNE